MVNVGCIFIFYILYFQNIGDDNRIDNFHLRPFFCNDRGAETSILGSTCQSLKEINDRHRTGNNMLLSCVYCIFRQLVHQASICGMQRVALPEIPEDHGDGELEALFWQRSRYKSLLL